MEWNWFDRLHNTLGYLILAQFIIIVTVLLFYLVRSPIWLCRRENQERLILLPADLYFKLVKHFEPTRYGDAAVARLWSGDSEEAAAAVRHRGMLRLQRLRYDGKFGYFVEKWGYKFPVFLNDDRIAPCYRIALWDWVFLGGMQRLNLVVLLFGISQELAIRRSRGDLLTGALQQLQGSLLKLKGSSDNYRELHRYVTEVLEALLKDCDTTVLSHIVHQRGPEVGGRQPVAPIDVAS